MGDMENATRDFRFGAVVGNASDIADWTALARAVEAHGYSTLLVPDTLATVSTFPALAAAAAVTTTLRFGSWVLAAPYRTPAATVRETRALQVLSVGRFELGIGAGRPGGERDARALGADWSNPLERVDQVMATIRAVSEGVDPVPRIVIAGSGPRMLRIAGEHAATLAIAASPVAGVGVIAGLADRARRSAGDRSERIELSLQVTGVGEEIPRWVAEKMGTTAADLREAGAAGLLSSDTDEAVDSLRRLRQVSGVSYITVPGQFAEQLAPVVQALTGT